MKEYPVIKTVKNKNKTTTFNKSKRISEVINTSCSDKGTEIHIIKKSIAVFVIVGVTEVTHTVFVDIWLVSIRYVGTVITEVAYPIRVRVILIVVSHIGAIILKERKKYKLAMYVGKLQYMIVQMYAFNTKNIHNIIKKSVTNN